jgi:hypothetical protein
MKSPFKDPYLFFLCIILLVVTLFFSIFSIYPDLNLDYPFIGGDSYDWISNGLYFSGADVRYSVRPPLLPLIMAVFIRLDILSYLPAFIWAAVFFAGLVFYRLLTFYVKNSTAFLTTSALWLNFSFQYQSLEIMADVLAACFLLFSVFFFIRSQKRKWNYLPSGLFAGLSAVTQQMALILPVPILLATALFRKGEFKSRQFWGGALVFVLLPGSWFLYKYLRFHTTGDVMVRHWGLLKLHFDSIGTYFYAGLSYLGIAGFILLVAGLLTGLKKSLKNHDHFFFSLLFLIMLAFLVFVYDFSYKRFLVYVFWIGGVFIAETLSALKNRLTYAAAASALLMYSLFPLPGKGITASRIALWPAPPIYLKADYHPLDQLKGRLDLLSVHVEMFPFENLGRFNNFHRVWMAAKDKQKQTELDPNIFDEDKAVIYIYDEARERDFRFPTVLRLGNALRKKVKYLPLSFVSRHLNLLSLKKVLSMKDYTIYRFIPPGFDQTWLLAFSSRNSRGKNLDKGSRIPASAPKRLPAGLKKAREISEYIWGNDAMVFVLIKGARSDLSLFYLPFVIETTEFFLIGQTSANKTEKSLGDLPVLERKLFGTTEVKKLLIFNRRCSAVFY